MAAKIRILSEETINKIAAGEVIENPASVVKELVDNAIDAGATEIQVDIQEGGRQLIRVTDNGCGMNSDDAILCLERHATSKIRTVEEIFSIGTMGFRGEAIPSIASISKFTLLTRPQGTKEEEGSLVIVEGGKLIRCSQAACASGTMIEVKSLFFNLPVRRKFQKSPSYDSQEIIKLVTTLALSYPHIHFRLTEPPKNLLVTLNSNQATLMQQLSERIRALLGSAFHEALVPVDSQSGAFSVQGYVGIPSHHRPNRTGQFLYINKRPVYLAPLIAQAVREGYGTMLPSQRYPVFVLHLTLPGDLVDANVHPQKREVRLRQEKSLKEFLNHSISAALQSKPPQLNLDVDFILEPEANSVAISRQAEEIKPAYHFALPLPTLQELTPISTPLASSPSTSPPLPPQPQVNSFPQQFTLNTPSQLIQRPTPNILAALPYYLMIESPSLPGYALTVETLCLVDQRAAQARILFEQLNSNQFTTSSQRFLIPHPLILNSLEAILLQEQLPLLHTMGFEIHAIGPTTFLIEAAPQLFGTIAIEPLIRDLLTFLQDDRHHEGWKEHLSKRLATTGAKVAGIKQRLSLEEGYQLLEHLFRCQTPYYSPQGEPIFALLKPTELQRFFMTLTKYQSGEPQSHE